MRTIEYFRAARRDIRQIWSYISDRNPRAAAKLVRQIVEAVEKLATTPAIGRSRSDVSDPRTRFFRVRSYLIAYRFDEESLFVLRVLHGRRDFKAIFKK
jgi:toxin ParE1/3/4